MLFYSTPIAGKTCYSVPEGDERMRGRITVLLGLIMALAGLLWYAETLRESVQAALAVQEVVPVLQQTVLSCDISETVPEETGTTQEVMQERIVDGIGYIGILEIPALSLKLPVISNWSNENGKIAPCRYSGSVYQNDLILCAHNYESHFGKLELLEVGDSVKFTDMGGLELSYQVHQSQILDGTDVENIRQGDWDLTLFTCTPGGKQRYVVRCKRIVSDSCQSAERKI